MGRLSDRWIAFLEDHRLVRRWIVPVAFMAVVLYPLFLLRWDARQSAQLVAVFLVASLVVGFCGMALQLAIEGHVKRKREQ